MADKLNVYQRINEVRRTNDYIQKKKEVDGKYKVVTHDQVTDAVRADLVKHGIVVVPSLVSAHVVQDTLLMTKNKQPIIRLECVFDVAFVNMDDPSDRCVLQLPAHALDTGDKAPGKACSYAVKMAMLKVFSIETGEEDEDRKEQEARGGSMTESAEIDWKSAIDELKQGEDPNPLWLKIKEACEAEGDREAATRLRGYLTTKVSALKKGNGKGKPEKANAPAH